MTFINLIVPLLVIALLLLYGLFTANFLTKKTGYEGPLMHRVKFEMKSLFIAVLVITSLATLVIGAFSSFTYILKFLQG